MVTSSTQLKIQLSDTCTLDYAYIGSQTLFSTASPFTALNGAIEQIYLNPDAFHYRMTVGGSLGFQGYTTFTASLLGQYIQTWGADCLIEQAGTFFRPCNNSPLNAELYFNGTIFTTSYTTNYTNASYGGYTTSGTVYGANICLRTVGTTDFCTIYNSEFFAARHVYDNNWNNDGKAYSGIVGFGKNSPVWDIVGNPNQKKYDIYMTNYNEWTWADASYKPHTANSVMNFGDWSTDYASETTFARISPKSGTPIWNLTEFGFGMTDKVANT